MMKHLNLIFFKHFTWSLRMKCMPLIKLIDTFSIIYVFFCFFHDKSVAMYSLRERKAKSEAKQPAVPTASAKPKRKPAQTKTKTKTVRFAKAKVDTKNKGHQSRRDSPRGHSLSPAQGNSGGLSYGQGYTFGYGYPQYGFGFGYPQFGMQPPMVPTPQMVVPTHHHGMMAPPQHHSAMVASSQHHAMIQAPQYAMDAPKGKRNRNDYYTSSEQSDGTDSSPVSLPAKRSYRSKSGKFACLFL